MPSTVIFPILVEVDNIHQQLLTGSTTEAVRMPGVLTPPVVGFNSNVSMFKKIATLLTLLETYNIKKIDN